MIRRFVRGFITFLVSVLLLLALNTIVGADGRSTVGPVSQAGGFAFLTGPNEGEPLDIALDYLHENKARWELTAADLEGLIVTDLYSSDNGVTHIYLRQRHNGIMIFNANINVNIAQDGSVINLGSSFVANASDRVNSDEPALSPIEAVISAAGHLGLTLTEPLTVEEQREGRDQAVVLSDGGISQQDIPVWLAYQSGERGELDLAWNVIIYENDGQNWWDMRVDALTGEVLDKANWIDHDDWSSAAGMAGQTIGQAAGKESTNLLLVPNSYLVYAMPVESPNYTSPVPPADARTTEVEPWLDAPTASPLGWHATSSTSWTNTQGNNVDAHKGTTRFNCGATLECDPLLDLTQEPTVAINVEAATVNLFYWNNIIHDVTYEFGFDEPAGNFQIDNFGLGGLGNDRVNANAQATGNCNANFATPADGSQPTMNMFLCDMASPERDGDLDNGVIVHEYGHGISNRLTGGPNNVNCLNNNEQMGEGWSDWLALNLTIEAGDAGTDSRGIGTWLFGQGPGGPGIRPTPYSTDMGINPTTYGDIGGLAVPHGVGYAWATMLWEVVWNLIDEYGYNPNFYDAWNTGGNNLATQLIIDGMKLQPCSPGFVDGRDAILAADMALTGGANQCLIWEGFAKRGLGLSANQGSSNNTNDGTEAFDLPAICLETLKIFKSADPDPAVAGDPLTYTLRVENNTVGTLTGVVISDTIPTLTSYIPGSASDGGSHSGGIVTWPSITMLSGDVVTRTFQVLVLPGAGPTTYFEDDFESGFGNWSMSGLWNAENEADSCGSLIDPFPSPTNAAYYGQNSTCTYNNGVANSGNLQTVAAIDLSGAADPDLSFWSYENTENLSPWDARTVQVSSNGGGSWTTLGTLTTENVWYESSFDLTAYAGSSILLRFNFDTGDGQFNNFLGWMVDDILVLDQSEITNTACVEANEGDNACDTIVTPVEAGGGGCTATVTNLDTSETFCGIQAGIDDADTLDGHTLSVVAGTYAEDIFVHKDLTILGDSPATTIVNPATDTGSSGDDRGWWLVDDGVEFHLSDITLDGTGFLVWQAIRHKGFGSVDNVVFNEIKYNPSSSYQGAAIAAFGTGPVDVTNSTFMEIGRIGVLYFGASQTNATFDGNSYTGKGAGDWLDYALDISNGAVVSATNNIISGNRGVASSDGSTSACILVSTFFGPGTSAVIADNDLSDCSTAVYAGFDSADTSNMVIKGNDIDNVDAAVAQTGTAATMNAYANNVTNFNDAGLTSAAGNFEARRNWWGAHFTQPTGVDNDSWDYRLGAAVASWSEGDGSAALADMGNSGTAQLSGGTGTAIIISHGRPATAPDAPFGNGISGYYDQMCSDFYDMFLLTGASGTWTASIPLDGTAGCAITLTDEVVFWIPWGTVYNTQCSPATNTSCWDAINVNRIVVNGSNLDVQNLTAAELSGTPFVAGSDNQTDPTSITLSIMKTSNSQIALLLLAATLALAGFSGWIFLADRERQREVLR